MAFPNASSMFAITRSSLQGRALWTTTENVPVRQRPSRITTRCSADTSSSAENQADDPLTEALKKADALMDEVRSQAQRMPVEKGQLISGGTKQMAASRKVETAKVRLQCDVNGCSIVPVTTSNTSSETMLESLEENSEEMDDACVFQGEGWKLGVNPRPADQSRSTSDYAAFVSGSDWSISLSHDEYRDFVHLLKSLRRGVATLEVCGDWGDEGSEAQLEMSTPRLWMQGQASQRRLSLLSRLWSRKKMDDDELPTVAFALRFVVRSDGTREAEGSWGPDVVMQVLKALDEEESIPSKTMTTTLPS